MNKGFLLRGQAQRAAAATCNVPSARAVQLDVNCSDKERHLFSDEGGDIAIHHKSVVAASGEGCGSRQPCCSLCHVNSSTCRCNSCSSWFCDGEIDFLQPCEGCSVQLHCLLCISKKAACEHCGQVPSKLIRKQTKEKLQVSPHIVIASSMRCSRGAHFAISTGTDVVLPLLCAGDQSSRRCDLH